MGSIIKFVLGKMPWLSGVPWRLVGIVAASAMLIALGWTVRGWKEASVQQASTEKALTNERQATTTRITEHNAVQAVDEKDAAASAKQRDEIQHNESALHQAVAGKPLLELPEVTIHEPAPINVVPVRSTTYRLCVNAAIDGTAASLTACEAAGGHASL